MTAEVIVALVELSQRINLPIEVGKLNLRRSKGFPAVISVSTETSVAIEGTTTVIMVTSNAIYIAGAVEVTGTTEVAIAPAVVAVTAELAVVTDRLTITFAIAEGLLAEVSPGMVPLKLLIFMDRAAAAVVLPIVTMVILAPSHVAPVASLAGVRLAGLDAGEVSVIGVHLLLMVVS
jgi:hypothetical protein